MKIGEKIKKLRIENNLKQLDLANALFLSEKTISSWENNRTIPDLNMIYKLSNIFKSSFIYLIDDSLVNDVKDELCIRLKLSDYDYNNIYKKIEQKSNNKKYIHQIDNYYKTNNQDKEFLRLRNEDGKCILNYKEKINDSSFKNNQVQIDNYDIMSNILNKLNFTIIGIIEKDRISFEINEFIINFDDVYNIGKFIEIKLLNDNDYEKIINLLNELNINYNMINMKKYIDYIK